MPDDPRFCEHLRIRSHCDTCKYRRVDQELKDALIENEMLIDEINRLRFENIRLRRDLRREPTI